jgi:ectoine hydroxylase-related dioxygenase (phytanoyl-CoA dioxygenase family)
MSGNAVNPPIKTVASEFGENGYVTLRNILSETKVERVSRAVGALLGMELAGDTRKVVDVNPSENFHLSDVLGRSDEFLDLVDQDAVLLAVGSILGPNIFCYHSHVDVNPPARGDKLVAPKALGWHRDSNRVNEDLAMFPQPGLSLKAAFWLTELAEAGMGNLAILRGSHLYQTSPLTDPYGHAADVVCAKAGDVTLFDRRVWHARTRNRSGVTRKAVFLGYSFRWLRPRDALTIPARILAEASPVRRQLLGAGTSAAGYYAPTSEEIPLMGWLAERAGSP